MGTVTGPHPRSGGNPYYRYDVSGAVKVQAVVAMLWAFLGTMKREQASEVLRNAHWERPLKNRTKCNRGHAYEGNRTKYGQCRECMKASDQKRRG